LEGVFGFFLGGREIEEGKNGAEWRVVGSEDDREVVVGLLFQFCANPAFSQVNLWGVGTAANQKGLVFYPRRGREIELPLFAS